MANIITVACAGTDFGFSEHGVDYKERVKNNDVIARFAYQIPQSIRLDGPGSKSPGVQRPGTYNIASVNKEPKKSGSGDAGDTPNQPSRTADRMFGASVNDTVMYAINLLTAKISEGPPPE